MKWQTIVHNSPAQQCKQLQWETLKLHNQYHKAKHKNQRYPTPQSQQPLQLFRNLSQPLYRLNLKPKLISKPNHLHSKQSQLSKQTQRKWQKLKRHLKLKQLSKQSQHNKRRQHNKQRQEMKQNLKRLHK